MRQLAVSSIQDTQELLTEWARWVLSYGYGFLGYPSVQSFRRLAGSSVRSALITDEEASKVDSLVAKLKQRDPEMGKAVISYYLSGCNRAFVARVHGWPAQRTRVLIDAGTAWLDAALDLSRKKT